MSSLTKSYTTGNIISVPFFQHEDDKNSGEARWLICLEDLQDEFIAVPLKSNTDHIEFHPKSFVIEKDSEEGKRMNLLNVSAPRTPSYSNKFLLINCGSRYFS